MFATPSLVALAALLVTRASAHGWVGNIIANDKQYAGPEPVYRATAPPGPIRQIASEQPVTDITSPLLACGGNATSFASELASAAAGSSISIQWFNGGGSPAWPHNTGPLLTYMAPCSTATCSDTATSLKFFKIAEDGQVPDGSSWVQAELMNGTRYNVTIPQGIPSGAYIMRHEIIALQNAASVGGAEHYPSCFQLTVTGGTSSLSQTAFLASLGTNATASFPGAYGPKDPGLLLNAYNTPLNYAAIFPGPAISDFLSNGASNSSVPPAPSKSSAPATALPTGPKTQTHSTSESLSTIATQASVHASAVSPNVMVTTITKVFVLTMTLGDGAPTATPVPTSSEPHLSELRPPTMSPSITSKPAKRTIVPYIAGKRHARRSASWRATLLPDA